MRFEDLNWMDVESCLETDDRLMLVLGACERHGYLSLLADIKIPLALATAVSERTHVLVAPPQNFGLRPYFAKVPGTICLGTETFLAVIGDLVRALHAPGFRRLLVVHGRGSNTPANALLSEWVNELPGLKASGYPWWLAPLGNGSRWGPNSGKSVTGDRGRGRSGRPLARCAAPRARRLRAAPADAARVFGRHGWRAALQFAGKRVSRAGRAGPSPTVAG